MRRNSVLLLTTILNGCASLVPSDPQIAKKKLAADLGLVEESILAVKPCTFAVTPPTVFRAYFSECALVETATVAYIAKAIPQEGRFEKSVSLVYSTLTGFNLRNWGLGASQLQLVVDSNVVSIHLKSGGKESMDRPEESQRLAASLRSKGVPEIESRGRVDSNVGSTIPIFIPARK